MKKYRYVVEVLIETDKKVTKKHVRETALEALEYVDEFKKIRVRKVDMD